MQIKKNLKKINKAEVEKEIENIEKNVYKLSFSDINYLSDLANFYMSFYKLEIDSADETKKENYKLYIEIIDSGLIILQQAVELKETNEDKKDDQSAQSIDTEFGFNKCKSGEIFDQEKNQCMPTPKKITKIKCANEEVYDNKQKKCIKKDSKSKKEGMSTLNPASINDENYIGSGNLNNFDEAKVKELAYDNLDKIIGNDNIRSFNSKTNELNDRQGVIMNQLKDVGPLMNQAMHLIKNIDMDAINNVSNQMTNMIGNLQDMKK